MYNYGLIGNCQISALISKNASIDWLCMPRPDSPPIFGKLLDEEAGCFAIEVMDVKKTSQYYVPNTNILITEFECNDSSKFEVIDFCPRFSQYNRMFRPNSLFRIINPISGAPSIRLKIRVIDGWTKGLVSPARGNSHLRYDLRNDFLRIATNTSITHLIEESYFRLHEKVYIGLTWGHAIQEDLIKVSEEFLAATTQYWQTWVKHCSIPYSYQRECIRSALALKLHCYEDTGAILAAITTSLPEKHSSNRNWDYRHCWIRDSYFALSAFHKLGHYEEMEGFLKFLINIVGTNEASIKNLRPVYSLDYTLPLPEIEHLHWKGYQNSRPVRSNNQAAEHEQHDVYGEAILALSPIYLDERFFQYRTKSLSRLLSELGRLCVDNISKPDAGLWEIRNGWQEHSFTNLMCWAGLKRLIEINNLLGEVIPNMNFHAGLAKAVDAIGKAVCEGVLRNGPRDESLDSSLLLLPIVNYEDKELNVNTVKAIRSNLRFDNSKEYSSYLFRYKRNDDFGAPETAFVICSFWLVQALHRIGMTGEAFEVMNDVLKSSNHLSLISEHYNPYNNEQYGNFPQAYSHVGLINAAFDISPNWKDIF